MKFTVTIQPIQGSEVSYMVGGFDRGDARQQGLARWFLEDRSRRNSQIAEVFVEPLVEQLEAQTEARLLGEGVVRVLPADVYDTLELSALVYGGIGAYYRSYYGRAAMAMPNCILGHAAFSSVAADTFYSDNPIEDALLVAGIDESVNDDAVVRINSRRRKPDAARVPFKRWAKVLGVVRGE